MKTNPTEAEAGSVEAVRKAAGLVYDLIPSAPQGRETFINQVTRIILSMPSPVLAEPEVQKASEDTKLLDLLESSVVQLHLFGNFLKGGSPNELRNALRATLKQAPPVTLNPVNRPCWCGSGKQDIACHGVSSPSTAAGERTL